MFTMSSSSWSKSWLVRDTYEGSKSRSRQKRQWNNDTTFLYKEPSRDKKLSEHLEKFLKLKRMLAEPSNGDSLRKGFVVSDIERKGQFG